MLGQKTISVLVYPLLLSWKVGEFCENINMMNMLGTIWSLQEYIIP